MGARAQMQTWHAFCPNDIAILKAICIVRSSYTCNLLAFSFAGTGNISMVKLSKTMRWGKGEKGEAEEEINGKGKGRKEGRKEGRKA